MSLSNKNLFSHKSDAYAKFRPSYPKELFFYLSSLVSEHACAWDCGTGNGQAALLLTPYFDHVIATDLSKEQIDNAVSHKKITYRVAAVGESNVNSHSIDLITVAQAFHWFDQQVFVKEVTRVAKKNAILAIWCYGLISISPDVDKIVKYLYKDILGLFWEQERKLVENEYKTVIMPFTSITSPSFPMTAQWTLEHLLGYLKTWSAWQKYTTTFSKDPLEPLIHDFTVAWGKQKSRQARWIITPKVWRILF